MAQRSEMISCDVFAPPVIHMCASVTSVGNEVGSSIEQETYRGGQIAELDERLIVSNVARQTRLR